MSLSTDYSTSKNQANLPSLDSDHIDLSHLNLDARVVLAFWFDKNNEQYWFEENDEFDQQIKERFGKRQSKGNAPLGALQKRLLIAIAPSLLWLGVWQK